ncbi:hypothetical protein [Pseudoalteromonas sp. APC 3355]|uniref:hypothetical protein n=1 Tax=Pseudoalteromonas sp. APC 3355 TaxID=3035199 RepID=UPI0025B3F526|nr:hypothetical protein [Pseudoalteromonas sp. APC 3355]MDN3474617.1 hypothetical protein [Pseudoalteromonas sp. APC 3355]
MDLFSVLQTYRDILIVIAATLSILAYIAYTNWDAVSLWWKGFKYHNFLFSKLRSLAKNPDTAGRWFHSETVVCQDYGELYSQIHKDGDYYESSKKYLSIVGESGRKPLGTLLMLGLFAVLVLEAWGFSYTMAGFIDLSASENTRVTMTWIVAIAFAVILAFLTHMMGHELYRNGILGRIRNNWQVDDTESRPRTLDDIDFDYEIDNFTDENGPKYKQRLNRLDVNSPRKKHTFTIGALVAIIAIGIIITFVRVKTLEVAQTQDAMCQPSSATSNAALTSLDDLYSSTPPPPLESQKVSAEAVGKGESEICQATKEGSWATFGMLAILFIVLQAFATWVSFKFGFVGKHSKSAWKNTHKFNTKNQYEAAMDAKSKRISQRAQKTLGDLQSRMAKVLIDSTMNSSVSDLLKKASDRTFLRYVEQESEQSLSSRNRQTQTMLEREREHSDIISKSTSQVTADEFKAVSSNSRIEQPTDEEIESQILTETKEQSLSDEELEKQILAEAQAKKQETPEEQRARVLEKLKAEGKL